MIPSRSSTACSSVSATAALAIALAAAVLEPVRASDAGAGAGAGGDRVFLSRPYTIEATAAYPCGLFHWVDSLAGASAGKTIPAHRAQYLERFGPLNDADRTQLAAFVAARAEHVARLRADRVAGDAAPLASAMLGGFCGSTSVEAALTPLRDVLQPDTWTGLSEALAHFRVRYDIVWSDGAIPNAFLERAGRDPALETLEAALGRMARFYGVDPGTAPPPLLALVPVPGGYGTHAEAIGRVLLLEIRESDRLSDEIAVIAHENAHFLWSLVPADRRERLAAYARSLDARAQRDFDLLGEALPTALGQGVADRSARPGSWSVEEPWYHTRAVDTFAKRIYPMVRYALDTGVSLDEEFLRRILAPPPRRGPGRVPLFQAPGSP